MMTARFFHGTTSDMSVGDILVPGDSIGISYYGRSEHVYATTTNFDAEEMGLNTSSITSLDRLYAAISTAQEWAFFAAEMGGCEFDTCIDENGVFHAEGQYPRNWHPCMHVYEIEPLGIVEKDTSDEVNATAVRLPAARIIREITLQNMAQFCYNVKKPLRTIL